jgi:hypothetical protein
MDQGRRNAAASHLAHRPPSNQKMRGGWPPTSSSEGVGGCTLRSESHLPVRFRAASRAASGADQAEAMSTGIHISVFGW